MPDRSLPEPTGPDPPPDAPAVGFYADDFTGAVDALLQLTRAGARARLLLRSPPPGGLARAAAGYDAIGVAGTARSLLPDELERQVRPALTALAALRPRVVQYKACSTADSSPTVGSLGRVLEIGREIFGQGCVPMLFAQPDFGRHTCFGHHFAAEGGVVHRLDRQPTMSRHPSTPMRESDLARHLGRQTTLGIGSWPFPGYADPAALTEALRRTDPAGLVLDALTEEHLRAAAAGVLALPAPVFAIGSGGLSTGLGQTLAPSFRARAGVVPQPRPGGGPVLAVSGSCSPLTARQVGHAEDAGWLRLTLPPGDVAAAQRLRVPALAALRAGRSVVVGSGGEHGGTDPVAVDEIAPGLTELLRAAVGERLTTRVVVCGGDTSSRVTALLGARALEIVANPVGNVVLCRVTADDPALDGLELLLKGGQVGPDDLFELVRAL